MKPIKYQEHILFDCPYAKEMREVLNKENFGPMGMAIAVDIVDMKAHYHNTFDEVYYLLEGAIEVKLHDPKDGNTWTEQLAQGDTFVVPKGLHHGITKASSKNKLMVMSLPPWYAEDENPSDKI